MSHIRVTRTILFTALAASMLMLLPSSAMAAEHIGFGIGFYGPVYPYGYWGPWGYPYAYGPYGYPLPYAYGPYGYYGRPLGEVHIKTPVADAQIYINGSYAGLAHDLKKFYLAPGTYNVEQRIGQDVQRERIYVVANRSLKLEFGRAGTPSPAPMPPSPPEAAQPQGYNAPYGAPPYGAPQPNSAPPQPNAAPQPAPEEQQQQPPAAEPAPQSAPAPEGQVQQ